MEKECFKGGFWKEEGTLRENGERGRSRTKFGNSVLFNERYGERGRSRIKYGMTPHFTTARGFTLIELLVVILIIGILAAVALPQYQLTVEKANFTQILTAAQKITEAEQRYYLEHGSYTTTPSELDIAYPTSTTGQTFIFPKGNCKLTYLSSTTPDSDKRIMCGLSSPFIVFYQYVTHNRHHCISYSVDNYKGDRLCQQFTGSTHWINGCNPVCHVYTKS